MNQTDRITKAEETTKIAHEIIDAERRAREEKTRRLRQARQFEEQSAD